MLHKTDKKYWNNIAEIKIMLQLHQFSSALIMPKNINSSDSSTIIISCNINITWQNYNFILEF